ALGDARVISALTAAKDSFNSYPLDRAAIAAGAASLADENYYRDTAAKIIRTREETASALSAMGYDVLPTQANFLFMGCGSASRARALFAFLREAKILVRYFEKPRVDDRLRVSVGTDAEMAAFLARVKEFAE
ncbi:MAG: aminotransferase class I/II-fold pyridoxal phosphate-dependent enzyme, partial [Clostridiales bacterium]|nr:aminotransferase class I/II-fold pyridoxal phosphate-dependent enzyme [Clostridiales bacterium]